MAQPTDTKRPKLYTMDDFRALLGGCRLPKLLEWRGDEIWLAVTTAELDDWAGEPEFEVLNRHPNCRPTTEPLLPARFTVEQFVAFEEIFHLFRWVYLKGEIKRQHLRQPAGEDCDEGDEGDYLDLVDHWTGLNEVAVADLRQRSHHAVELVEALLAGTGPQLVSACVASPKECPGGDSVQGQAKLRGMSYWRVVLFQNIGEFDRLSGGKADVRTIISRLATIGDRRLRAGSTPDVLEWKNDIGEWKKLKKKTIENAVLDARRSAAIPN